MCHSNIVHQIVTHCMGHQGGEFQLYPSNSITNHHSCLLRFLTLLELKLIPSFQGIIISGLILTSENFPLQGSVQFIESKHDGNLIVAHHGYGCRPQALNNLYLLLHFDNELRLTLQILLSSIKCGSFPELS